MVVKGIAIDCHLRGKSAKVFLLHQLDYLWPGLVMSMREWKSDTISIPEGWLKDFHDQGGFHLRMQEAAASFSGRPPPG
jgi:hypothetical protein